MEPSPSAIERTPAADEVLRRVGRNLVVFQQVELALKFLTTHARFHAPSTQFSERFAKHAESIGKRSMGDLTGKLVDTVLQQVDIEDAAKASHEDWLGFRFKIEGDAEVIARHERELKELVDQRNELVHHFLPLWQKAVAGDAEATLSWLDAQRASAVATLDRLTVWARTLQTARQELTDFLASDEGERIMELGYLRSNRLVEMLGQIAMCTPRADGWTSLKSAAQEIKREAPIELEEMSERFGHPNLTAILHATELFDVEHEMTSGGGTRIIYRTNERWRLENQLTPSSNPATPSP